jgi:hypothetical protein
MYNDNAGDCEASQFLNQNGILLHSQRLLKGAPKYVQRNSTFSNFSCSKVSIYLKIHQLMAQTNDIPSFHEFMINVEKTLYFLQDQFDGCAVEDILGFLIPESEETAQAIDDSALNEEMKEL